MIELLHDFDLSKDHTNGGIEAWIIEFLEFYADARLTGIAGNTRPKFGAKGAAIRALEAPSFLSRLSVRPDVLRFIATLVMRRPSFEGPIVVHRIELPIVLKVLYPKTRVVLVVHSDMLLQTRKGSDSMWRFFPAAYFFVEKFAYKFSDTVLSHSRDDYSRVADRFGHLVLLKGWFNDTIFYPPKVRQERRGVLWAGRLEKVKNPHLAIEAFAQIADIYPGNLEIAGEGSLRNSLVDQIGKLGLQDRVHLLGLLPPAELANRLRGAEALLITSHFEGSSKVLLEAVASGCRVVCHPQSDADKVKQESPKVFYVAEYTPRAFAKKLRSVLVSRDPSSDGLESRRASKLIPAVAGQIVG